MYKLILLVIFTAPYLTIGQDNSLFFNKIDDLEAIDSTDRAVVLLQEFLESENSKESLGYASIRLGTILSKRNLAQTGIEHYKNALKYGIQSEDSMLIGKAYYGIAAAYHQMGLNSDSIESNYLNALQILTSIHDSLSVSYIYDNLSFLYSNNGEYDKAESLLEKSKILHLALKDFNGVSNSLYSLGYNLSKQQRSEEAIKYFEESIKVSSDHNLYEALFVSLRSCALEYQKLKRWKKAAGLFQKLDSIGHDYYHIKDQETIQELETRYQTAEVERDNALKQAEIEENRRQLLLLYAFSLLLILASVSTYLFFNQRRKRQKLASEKAIQDLLQNQEMKTTYALLEGQDKERKRIAAELHDNLGSILVTLNMYADTLQNQKPKDIPALAQKIADVTQLANTETRKISHSLDSGMLRHFGLEAAIKQLTEAVSSARKIKFNLSLQTGEISSDASIEIYRIIQELVNNTLKHAQCSKVHLELTHVDHSLSIIYEDNGVGFNPKEVSGGMGLKNIQNRAAKLDGELIIDSTPGKGSSFIIEIPHL